VIRHDPRLTDAQIRALTDLVASFGDGPAIPQVTGGGDVGRGNELYIANCAACHGATGTGNAIGGGTAAANLHEATPLEIVEAMRVGPGAMPEFAFGDADEAAIVAYVQYLRSAPSPGGLSLGGLGPVPEGFVAVAIGLVLLVGAAILTGHVPPTRSASPDLETTARRRRSGEPAAADAPRRG
jgi:ubiquinol-cytochrome c reductase cytochrome c subunit